MFRLWVIFIIGSWIMISPWLLDFSEISLAKWSNIIFGVILVIISVWAMAEKPKKV